MARNRTSTVCRKLPNTATKRELEAAHKQKMMGKHFRNREFGSYLSRAEEIEARHNRKKGYK